MDVLIEQVGDHRTAPVLHLWSHLQTKKQPQDRSAYSCCTIWYGSLVYSASINLGPTVCRALCQTLCAQGSQWRGHMTEHPLNEPTLLISVFPKPHPVPSTQQELNNQQLLWPAVQHGGHVSSNWDPENLSWSHTACLVMSYVTLDRSRHLTETQFPRVQDGTYITGTCEGFKELVREKSPAGTACSMAYSCRG